jgi:hypothetical protein
MIILKNSPFKMDYVKCKEMFDIINTVHCTSSNQSSEMTYSQTKQINAVVVHLHIQYSKLVFFFERHSL